jgi:hypothetical protein
MQNPITYLTSLFQEPPSEQPLDARIIKTFAKWEAVQMAADYMHATFEVTPLHDAEDLLRYQQMLVDYAVYTVYAALMKQRLDQLMPGADVDDYAAALHQYHVEAELPRLVKKLMRPRARSISGAHRAAHDTVSGLRALYPGCP